jgi:tetratricopeptide (TPR) repeat protein
MQDTTASRTLLVAVVAALPALSAQAQYREYYLHGKVVDTEKRPVAGVEIHLRDDASSRSFDVKTDKQGEFRLAGLPHGVYQVTIAKEGFVSRQDLWKFETPQDSMQRIELPEVVLASESQRREAQRASDASAGLKQAAEKVGRNDFDGAIAQLQGLLKDDPRDAGALYLLGLSYTGKKMPREAVAALSQAVELKPDLPGAYFELGVAYRQLGDLPKALEAYDKSLAQEPSRGDSAYNAGLILFETNRIDEALVRFEQALQSRPADPEVLEMTARCYIHQGRFDKAVELLERAKAATTDPAKTASLEELVRQTRALKK